MEKKKSAEKQIPNKIRNSKSEARNKSEILILKCSKQNLSRKLLSCFGHSDFENLNLFRISIFDIRIYTSRLLCDPVSLSF